MNSLLFWAYASFSSVIGDFGKKRTPVVINVILAWFIIIGHVGLMHSVLKINYKD